MTQRDRRRQRGWTLLCVVAVAGFVSAVVADLVDRVVLDTPVAGALWLLSGLVAVGAGVAACRVDDDSTHEPGHLRTFVRGLRDEWHRHA